MIYKGKRVQVQMEWDKDILFTYGDLVFNLVNSEGTVVPHLMMCNKDLDVVGQVDSTYWTPFESSGYRNRVRKSELFTSKGQLDTAAINTILNSDRVISSECLSTLISHFMGEGYNDKGDLQYLDKGTNLNNLRRTSRFRLYPGDNYYFNLPKAFSIEASDYHSYAVVETTNVGGDAVYQSVMFFYSDQNTMESYYRSTNSEGGWTKWETITLGTVSKESIEFMNDTAMEYYNSYKKLKEVTTKLCDGAAKLVFSKSYSGSSTTEKINIHYYDPGSYQVLVIINNTQHYCSFTSEDIQYSKLATDDPEVILLSSPEVKIIKENSRVKLKVAKPTDKMTVKILRFPLVTL